MKEKRSSFFVGWASPTESLFNAIAMVGNAHPTHFVVEPTQYLNAEAQSFYAGKKFLPAYNL